MGKRYAQKRKDSGGEDEFLWLISLSDLMILLFIFFVVLFSFTRGKIEQADFQRIVATLKNKTPPPDPVETIKKQLENFVKEQNLTEQIEVKREKNAVEVNIRDKVLFASGEFLPTESGEHVMQTLARTLEIIPEQYQIGIEGHTDDVPIHTRDIQDNWDLSSKRALSVLKSLSLSSKALGRSVIMAYGDTRPVAPNRDPAGAPIPENQSKNRRVTVRIF